MTLLSDNGFLHGIRRNTKRVGPGLAFLVLLLVLACPPAVEAAIITLDPVSLYNQTGSSISEGSGLSPIGTPNYPGYQVIHQDPESGSYEYVEANPATATTEITDPLAGRSENPWAESYSELTSTVTNGNAASVLLAHSSSSLAYFPDYVYDLANAETYPDYWASASFQTDLLFGYEMTIASEYGNTGEILASISADSSGFNFYEWSSFNVLIWDESLQDFAVSVYSWSGGSDYDIEVPLILGERYFITGSFGGGGSVMEFLGSIYSEDTVDGYMEGLHSYDYSAFLSLAVNENPVGPVPEPSTLIMMGIGLASLIGVRRRAR
jgi:hypothetical protein